MSLTNNLKKQVDLPVWEWCRAVPAGVTAVSGLSSTCTADNSLYHVTFGRYIYFFQSVTTLSAGSGLNGFYRYDTISDSYQILCQPPLTAVAYTGMQFAGGQGYYGSVLSSTFNTITAAALTGKTLKGFDIRIIGGTGNGQQRIISDVSDATIWDTGTVTAVTLAPQSYVTDSNKNWAINQWVGYQVRLVHTNGQSQVRKIMYNTSNTLYYADVAKFPEDQFAYNPISPSGTVGTNDPHPIEAITASAASPYQIESSVITVDTNWKVQPDATSKFVVRAGGIWLISAGTAATYNYFAQYYDIAADSWYIRNGSALTSSLINAAGTDGTVVNSGENATVWERGIAQVTGSDGTHLADGTTVANGPNGASGITSVKNWTTDQWKGYRVRIFSGKCEDQMRVITGNTSSILTISPGWSTDTPDATSRYFIEGFDGGTLTSVSQKSPLNAITINAVANTSGSTSVTMSANTPAGCNNWYIFGPGITLGTTISSGQGTKNLVLSAVTTAAVSGLLVISPNYVSATGAATSTINTNTITTASATPYNCNGWYIAGAGVGNGAVILSGQGTTTLTVSVLNTATFSAGSLYLLPVSPITPSGPQFFTATGSGTTNTTLNIGVACPYNCVGWYASGTNIAINAIVTVQSTTTLTLSAANIGSVSGNVILSPTITTGTYASGGAQGDTTVTVANNTPPFCNGWFISGTGITQGATIVSGQGTATLTLSIANASQISGVLTFSATTISAGATIAGSVLTVPAGTTTGVFYPGQALFGTGVQASNIIMSSSGACYTNGTVNVVQFAVGNPLALGIQIGMVVTDPVLGTNITGGTTVTAVTSSSVTLSAPVAATLTSRTLQFQTAWVGTGCSNVGMLITTATSTKNLCVGSYMSFISGTTGAFANYSYVTAVVDDTHFTVSVIPSAVLAVAIIQASPYQTTIISQLSGVPGGAGTYNILPSQVVPALAIATTPTLIAGKGTSVVQDNTKNWLPERWTNYAIRIKAGTGMGQVRQIVRTVPGNIAYTSDAGATSNGTLITVTATNFSNLVVGMILNVSGSTGVFAPGTYVTSIVPNSTTFLINQAPVTALSGGSNVITAYPNNTLIITPAWITPPDTTSVYTIHGDTDKNFISMAGTTPTYVHNIDSDVITTGRMQDWGATRAVTAQYADYLPVSCSAGVPVLPIIGAVGYIGTVNIAVSSAPASNVATVTFSNAATSDIYPIGSWITVAGSSQATWNGTWQVIGSTQNTVSFYSTTASGSLIAQGTVNQAVSITVGGTLAGGAHIAFGQATGVTLAGCTPVTYNVAMTILCGTNGTTGSTYGGYQSAPGATFSSPNFSVTDVTNLKVGMIPTVTAGQGTLTWGTNSYISSINTGNNTFVVTPTPTGNLGANAVITVLNTFATSAITAIGSLSTFGYVQKTPQGPTGLSRSGTTATITLAAAANTIFPIGSWIVVTGAVPGAFNGVYQVTGNSATTVVYSMPVDPGANASGTYGTVGIATPNLMVTTNNSHNFLTGYTLTMNGDQGLSQNIINGASGPITLVSPDAALGICTRFIITMPAPVAPLGVYTMTTTTLCDGSKNWIPNQWAGCIVTLNSTLYVALAAQSTYVSAYVLSNTNNTLVFPAGSLAAAPLVAVSRYVITAPAASLGGNTIGAQDYGLAQGSAAAETATLLTDVTKSWATPGNQSVTATSVSGVNCTVSAVTGLYPGMIAVVTLGNNTLPAGTTLLSINSSTTISVSGTGFTTANNCTLTFAAVCSCPAGSTTVTVTGYSLANLSVGMNLAVTSTTNLSNLVLCTGAFVLNAGTGLTPVKVTNILTATNTGGTFTISAPPVVPLLNAAVQASFWFTSQWISRRIRQLTGQTVAAMEQTASANTYNSITTATFTNTTVSGVTAYAIMQQPLRGAGTALLWNFGASDLTRVGKYLYQARGGNMTGFDRLNLTTDKWEFLTPMPNYEPINTGSMFAYDGNDRIYFTANVTQRVYYLDTDTMQIHPAGMYPYTAGAAHVGNRMEIFETIDGLKYLWLNRHSNVECFRQLLWY